MEDVQVAGVAKKRTKVSGKGYGPTCAEECAVRVTRLINSFHCSIETTSDVRLDNTGPAQADAAS